LNTTLALTTAVIKHYCRSGSKAKITRLKAGTLLSSGRPTNSWKEEKSKALMTKF